MYMRQMPPLLMQGPSPSLHTLFGQKSSTAVVVVVVVVDVVDVVVVVVFASTGDAVAVVVFVTVVVVVVNSEHLSKFSGHVVSLSYKRQIPNLLTHGPSPNLHKASEHNSSSATVVDVVVTTPRQSVSAGSHLSVSGSGW